MPWPKGKPRSKEAIEKTASAHRGRKKPGVTAALKGRKRSNEDIIKIKLGWNKRRVALAQQGVVATHFFYYEWRKAVIARDKACVRCGSCRRLNAHHIKSSTEFPELRFVVSNGETLCHKCHRKHHAEENSRLVKLAREAIHLLRDFRLRCPDKDCYLCVRVDNLIRFEE